MAIAAALWVLSADGLRWSFGRRRPAALDEAAWLGAIAAELRAGSSVRSALASASVGESDSVALQAGRLAQAGAPMQEIAAVVEELPGNGPHLAAALQVIARTGGRSAAVFDGLADRAVETLRRARERRIATAQARMSALVVAALPMIAFVFGGAERIGRLIASGPGGATLAVVGVGMQLVGLATVWRLARP